MSKSFASGTAWLSTQQAVAFVAMTVLHVVAARVLGPASYGFLAVLLAFLSLLSSSLLFGIPDAVSKLTAGKETAVGTYMASGLRFQLLLSVVLAGVLFVGSDVVSGVLGLDAGPALRTLALTLPFTALAYLYAQVLNGLHQFRRQSLVLGAQTLLRVAGILIPILMGLGVQGAVWGLLASSVLSLVHSWWWARDVQRHRVGEVRMMVTFSLQLTLAYVLFEIGDEIDFVLLQVLTSDAALVGLFSAALALIGAIEAVELPIMGALYPVVARCHANRNMDDLRRQIGNAGALVVGLLVPLCVGTFVVASEVIEIFFGLEYLDVAYALGPLAIATLLGALYAVFDTVLRASGRAMTSFSVAGIVLSLQVGLDVVLIGTFGLPGLIAAVLVSSMVALLIAVVVVRRVVTLQLPWGTAVVASLLAAMVFWPLWTWKPDNAFVVVGLAAVCVMLCWGGTFILSAGRATTLPRPFGGFRLERFG